MAQSRRWASLARDIDTLRRQFLPDPFDPLGQYPDADRVQAYARAFLVLSHAEIESFLEDWAKEIARASELVWKTSGRVTLPLAFLLSTHAERLAVPRTLSGPNASDSPTRLAVAVTKLFQSYYKLLKDNNGVKEKNLLALFGPLGMPASATGATLLPDLDAFGASRGAHAHQSARAVQTQLDPETEYKRVMNLLADLIDLDHWLVDYKRRIR